MPPPLYRKNVTYLYAKNRNSNFLIYRTPLFDRCMQDMHRKGGAALMAVKKAEEYINHLICCNSTSARKKYRFTLNGEYRIKNCKKVDLVEGYRLVFIKKDCCLIFVYIGSHDDCFRWIERNKGISYEISEKSEGIELRQKDAGSSEELSDEIIEQKKFVEQYEKRLIEQIDENLLVKIFHGWHIKDKKKTGSK